MPNNFSMIELIRRNCWVEFIHSSDPPRRPRIPHRDARRRNGSFPPFLHSTGQTDHYYVRGRPDLSGDHAWTHQKWNKGQCTKAFFSADSRVMVFSAFLGLTLIRCCAEDVVRVLHQQPSPPNSSPEGSCPGVDALELLAEDGLICLVICPRPPPAPLWLSKHRPGWSVR